MSPHRLFYSTCLAVLVIGTLVLPSCSRSIGSPTAPQASSLPSTMEAASPSAPSTAPTTALPSTTAAPLAARVNGEGITLAEYQAELGRYQAALGGDPTPEDEKRVLDDLINQTLLAQAATEQGYTFSEADLQARLDQLAEQKGGAQALTDWMKANGYSEADFRLSLDRSIRAAWMRDQVIDAVPETAEQVHAHQILVRTPERAAELLAQLKAGSDFTALAKKVDPLTGGELGWFPRGILFDSKVEEAAFNLQPGQFSEVIQSRAGYHILQVIERDEQHPLDPQARLTLQFQALQKWIEDRRSQSEIEIL